MNSFFKAISYSVFSVMLVGLFLLGFLIGCEALVATKKPSAVQSSLLTKIPAFIKGN